MQTSNSIEDFFLDDHTDSDLWDWDGNFHHQSTWLTLLNWFNNTFFDFKNWLSLIYFGTHTKRLPYHRCHICNNEIDENYLYNSSDLRNRLCLLCYDIECQKIIDLLTIE